MKNPLARAEPRLMAIEQEVGAAIAADPALQAYSGRGRERDPDHTRKVGELTVSGVKHFAELPTKAIDDLIEGVEAKVAHIKQLAEEIKSYYSTRTAELTDAIELLNKACVQSEGKMNELHSEMKELYAPKRQLQKYPPGAGGGGGGTNVE